MSPPVSANEQYSGPQAEAMGDEQHLTRKFVDTTTCRCVDTTYICVMPLIIRTQVRDSD